MVETRTGRHRLAVLLVCALTVQSVYASQVAAGAAPLLNIEVVEGEGAINNIRQRAARETIVEVTDENHKPVAGALVVFTAPNNGPSGVFGQGSRILRVTTDTQGRAAAQGFRANSLVGNYNIEVEATSQGRVGRKVISQSNAKIAGPVLGIGLVKLLALLGAAGAGVGAAVALRGGSSSSSAPSSQGIVLQPGAPSVRGPN
jgi:hypothetical protein